ncbi:MAG TPA: C39 family peptidase, partial [Phycisphaerae bacterium]|nr:C39 family peptidase [Phycisphaerae bacterium]
MSRSFQHCGPIRAALVCFCLIIVGPVQADIPSKETPAGGLDQELLVLAGANAATFSNPLWSPDGKWIALSDSRQDGVYLLDREKGTCLRITNSPSSGYAYNWSHDGRRLGFKLLIPPKDGDGPLLQMPVMFDVRQQQLTALHPAVARAGVPSFTADGRVGFAIDQELWILDDAGEVLKKLPLGHYANLAPISPDGTKAACNDANDRIWVLDLRNGDKTPVTPVGTAYFNPVWSPDSSRLVVSTVSGQLKTVDLRTGAVAELDEGSRPSWSPDGNKVFYSRTDRVDGARVTRSGVYSIRPDGSGKTPLTSETSEYAVGGYVSPDDGKVAYVSLLDGQVYETPLGGGATGRTLGTRVALTDEATAIQAWDGMVSGTSADASSAVQANQLMADVQVAGIVPYLHQVYDTPNWFNGHWACGASAALMGINYYGILPWWDVTCSYPYTHVSHYGRYVCEIYAYNGYTYNIGSPDASGTTAWGGYGYIVRNNWIDTKGYMRDYIINHGLGSSVDWSPTWSELQAEVGNNNPFILLNSLTTAGHYITTIGYVTGQYTGIFNDPYGNKNTGYVNYNGAGVKYDWPGYNNGYSNLNTVHCFIYCRGTVNQPPTITQHPTSLVVPPGGTATFTVGATGTSPLSYQWQKNGSNVTNGGHY